MILVLITGIVIITTAISLGLGSVNSSQIRVSQSISGGIFFNIDGCAEEALARINRNNSYSGETIIINNTSCVITVSGTETMRTVNIVGTNSDYTRSLQINVTIFPSFTVNSWQELTS